MAYSHKIAVTKFVFKYLLCKENLENDDSKCPLINTDVIINLVCLGLTSGSLILGTVTAEVGARTTVHVKCAHIGYSFLFESNLDKT